MIIDCYTHFSVRKWVSEMARLPDPKMNSVAKRMSLVWDINPNFVDLDTRIHDLDKYEIDIEVTMVHPADEPNLYKLSEIDNLRVCKLINDECANFQSRSKGRIHTMGVAPLLASNDVLKEEMRRAVKDLGLKGFMVSSNEQGIPIDKFKDFWAEAERLGALIYIHPYDGGDSQVTPYEFDYDLMHVMGWPYQTTLMLCRLVFSGVMKDHPNLKIVGHHMGGMIPFYAGRISESYRKATPRFSKGGDKQVEDYGARATSVLSNVGLDKPIFDYFKMFYFDTAVGGSAYAVKCGYDTIGADHIIFGTDYPWGPDSGRERLATYPGMVRDAISSSADLEKIFSGNVLKLLGI